MISATGSFMRHEVSVASACVGLEGHARTAQLLAIPLAQLPFERLLPALLRIFEVVLGGL
jgi:hypothetical protein